MMRLPRTEGGHKFRGDDVGAYICGIGRKEGEKDRFMSSSISPEAATYLCGMKKERGGKTEKEDEEGVQSKQDRGIIRICIS
jgi:hypothetical protein